MKPKFLAFTLFTVAIELAAGASNARCDEKPLPPTEARQRLGERVVVQMEVRAAKDRLEKRGEIYLDSETDFHDETNLAAVITRRGAEALRTKGIGEPAEHFRGKLIRVRGIVKEVDNVRRIEIDEADQIEIISS
ncbi:MAG: hypothetical protein J5I93_30165 [Pirellulaceae bacterium]|nr:hypothetical protein [Pirellulaceae bacterium]